MKSHDQELYDELVKNYAEDMIAQPLISKYFNIYYGDEIFLDNGYFLEILKEKDNIFKQKLDDTSKYNGKKRYKIC